MKKTKLITSIFALCFSLLALSFGVYAAVKQVDYTIGGTISYQVDGVYAEITTKVYRYKGEPTTKNLESISPVLSSSSFSEISSLSDIELVKEIETVSTLNIQDDNFVCDDVATGISLNFGEYDDSVDISERKGYVYYIVTNITNLSQDVAIKASIVETPTEIDNTWQNNVDSVSGDTLNNIVVTYGLSNLTTSISETSFSYTIRVEKDETPDVVLNYTANAGGDVVYLFYSTDGVNFTEFFEGTHTASQNTISIACRQICFGYYVSDSDVTSITLTGQDINYSIDDFNTDIEWMLSSGVTETIKTSSLINISQDLILTFDFQASPNWEG